MVLQTSGVAVPMYVSNPNFQLQVSSLQNSPVDCADQEIINLFTKMSFSIAAVDADVPGLLSSIARRSSGVRSGCLIK